MWQFAASGLLATAVIGLLSVAVMRRIGTDEAIRDAKQVTALAGRGIVEPSLTRGVLHGDPAALARLDRTVRSRVLRDGIVRVKVWTRGGTIIYSDEPRLRGARYPMGAAEVAAIDGGRVEAELSDLSRPENRFERDATGCSRSTSRSPRPAGGRCSSRPTSACARSPRAAGGCGSASRPPCSAACCCCSWSTCRWRARWPAASATSTRSARLLQRTVDASDLERRRIAADLHDGVVQDLVGVSYELAAEAERLPGADSSPARAALLHGDDARGRASGHCAHCSSTSIRRACGAPASPQRCATPPQRCATPPPG